MSDNQNPQDPLLRAKASLIEEIQRGLALANRKHAQGWSHGSYIEAVEALTKLYARVTG